MAGETRKCEFCKKDYIINPNLNNLKVIFPKNWQNMKYIPVCDCFENHLLEKSDREFEENQRKALQRKIESINSLGSYDCNINNASIDKIDTKYWQNFAKTYCKKVVDDNISTGFLLYGSVGTGKTYLVGAIRNELVKSGKSVLFLTSLDILRILKDFDSKTTKTLLNAIVKCDVFIMDDFGSERTTEWVSEAVFTLIDLRYRVFKSGKPMLITSNLDWHSGDFTKIDGNNIGRIQDRIKEMCHPFLMDGESKRKAKK